MVEDKLSFIPKKTIAPTSRGGGLSVFGSLSFLLFFISGLVAGGLFFYGNDLRAKVDEMSISLERAQPNLEMTAINEIIKVSERIDTAKILLNEHKTIKPIFNLLEKKTLDGVSYGSFNYAISEEGEVTVVLGGTANGYSDLALQVDIFEKDKNIIDPFFSGISAGEKGRVSFNVSLKFDPSFVAFMGGV